MPAETDSVDIAWMTYAELGQSRGISLASAKRLANRRHWHRQPGNDGTVRIAVPAGAEEPQDVAARTVPRDVLAQAVTALGGALVEIREGHGREVAAFMARLDAAEAARNRAIAEATAALQRVEALTAEQRGWWSQRRWTRLRAAWRGQ
jgi:hypothetical protein